MSLIVERNRKNDAFDKVAFDAFEITSLRRFLQFGPALAPSFLYRLTAASDPRAAFVVQFIEQYRCLRPVDVARLCGRRHAVGVVAVERLAVDSGRSFRQIRQPDADVPSRSFSTTPPRRLRRRGKRNGACELLNPPH